MYETSRIDTRAVAPAYIVLDSGSHPTTPPNGISRFKRYWLNLNSSLFSHPPKVTTTFSLWSIREFGSIIITGAPILDVFAKPKR